MNDAVKQFRKCYKYSKKDIVYYELPELNIFNSSQNNNYNK